MPSSYARPGPHDKIDPVTGRKAPRAYCTYLKANGKHCMRFRSSGATKLCRFHIEVASGQANAASASRKAANRNPAIAKAGTRGGGPIPRVVDLTKASMTTHLVNKAKSATAYVIDYQARQALEKLRNPAALDQTVDPRMVLLDSVNSAWRQRQVWEAMLASVPDEDYAHIGEIPLPGGFGGHGDHFELANPSARGARIEAIQKMLSEATKIAARTHRRRPRARV
jgi:hypothetical protein